MSLTSSLGIADSALGLSMVLGDPSAHTVSFQLDAFNANPAAEASRILPVGIVPADGTHVYCLGRDLPGLVEYMLPGNYVEIAQDVTTTATTLAFQARTRAGVLPLPSGYAWKASMLIDNVEIGARTIYRELPIDWDWKLNWGALAAGSHRLAFRLTLTGPALAPAPAFPYLVVEIPAFYLDNLVLSTDTAPQITNEGPAINQGISNGYGPPNTTSIVFDVFDVTAGGVRATSINVTVNGQPAISGGAFQAGWTGTIAGDSSMLAHVTLTPTSPFTSAQIITVAASASNHVPQTATKTWQFEVADTTPPAMYSVVAIGTETLRVTWTKAIDLDDPTDADDGLNQSLYTLVPLPPDALTPAVTPIVVGATIVNLGNPSVIDLTTDIELSPGVPYRLTESGVSDTVGNVSSGSIVFTAFVPPKPAARQWDIYRMLPQLNRQEDDPTYDLKKFIACIQEVTDLLLYDIDTWPEILDVDVAGEAFLDAMLADLGNPFPFVLDELHKRKLIRLLVSIYKQKGTAIGIINTVRFFTGLTVTITTYTGDTMHLGISELGVDWILGPGTRFALYSFRVVSGVTLTADQRAAITFIARYMKVAHEHFIEIVEPTTPPVYDPVELGVSHLGVDWLLH